MFELLYIAYALVCGVVLWLLYRDDRQEWWVRFIWAACLPVIGLLVPLFRSGRWLLGQRAVDVSMFERIGTSRLDDSVMYQKPVAEREMNIVPLEEALLVNDFTTRRKVMIDLLKHDSLEYMDVLQMAVANEDTETSHYAVSAIIGIKEKLTATMQQLAVQYEENKGDPYVLRSYADVLANYMRSGFLDERTIQKHKYTYSTVLGQLLELEPYSEDAYLSKINVDLELGEYGSAEKTALSFLEHCPRNEQAYLSLMTVYFTLRSFDRLQDTLAQLKQSPIRLSNQALTTVRYWSEGM